MQTTNNVKISTDREFEEVEGGRYNNEGFYITPNGSFWDPDGVYFNREGLDRHEGYYDKNLEYHPGKGWIPHLMCYEDEMKKKQGDFDLYEDELDYDNLDDLYEEIDYGKMAEEEQKHIIQRDRLTFSPIKKQEKKQNEEKVDIDDLFKN